MISDRFPLLFCLLVPISDVSTFPALMHKDTQAGDDRIYDLRRRGVMCPEKRFRCCPMCSICNVLSLPPPHSSPLFFVELAPSFSPQFARVLRRLRAHWPPGHHRDRGRDRGRKGERFHAKFCRSFYLLPPSRCVCCRGSEGAWRL